MKNFGSFLVGIAGILSLDLNFLESANAIIKIIATIAIGLVTIYVECYRIIRDKNKDLKETIKKNKGNKNKKKGDDGNASNK